MVLTTLGLYQSKMGTLGHFASECIVHLEVYISSEILLARGCSSRGSFDSGLSSGVSGGCC